MSYRSKIALACCAALAGFACGVPAQATVLAPGSTFTGLGGTVTAYFIGYSAADTDKVTALAGGSGATGFFTNNATAIGTSANLGVYANGAEVEFKLTDLSIPATWYSGPASRNADNSVHARLATAATNFTGLSLASYAYALNNANGVLAGATFVGFEDRAFPGADADYNDLVFAVVASRAASVPEPVSMALLGTGLLGLGLVRRRRAG